MTTDNQTDKLSEQNRILGRKFFAEQDRLHALASELCATDYKAHLGGNPPMDRAGHDAFGTAFYAGFPDLKHHIEDVIATPDAVVVRFVLRGTHTGTLFGAIPATQRAVTIAANVILRVRDGKVHTLLGVLDEAGMLRQLGVMPS